MIALDLRSFWKDDRKTAECEDGLMTDGHRQAEVALQQILHLRASGVFGVWFTHTQPTFWGARANTKYAHRAFRRVHMRVCESYPTLRFTMVRQCGVYTLCSVQPSQS